ncbi:DUF3618 domain-containing protein [Streptomyces bungoensis]|uniref:DUF3618 domain-containing protein n=1 Tax=Streptomyces bungoensis TaxID=285568 RepID=UPI0034349CF5
MTHRNPHGSGAKGPDELRHQIEQTRHQLGDTVAQLVEKTDIKGRARARVADLRDKAGAMTVQLRSSAAQAGHGAQGRASGARHALQGRAAQAGHAVQGAAARAGHAVEGRAAQAGHSVQGAGHAVERHTPQPVRSAAQTVGRLPRPVLIAAAAGAVLVTVGLLRRRHH